MKKKSTIILLLVFVMIMSLMASACSKKPDTIEEYLNNDENAMEQVTDAADSSGLSVSFSENDVIYSFDLSQIDGATEELVKSDVMKETLTSSLGVAGDSFVGLCAQLEQDSKIEGIQVVINYTYGDEVIVSKTFNSSGPVE